MKRAALVAIALAFLALSALSQETTLRSQSNVVLIPTLVKDRQGGIVYGLQASDFVVEDDGIEQPARLDEAPEGQPVSIVVAIQCGRRANYEFQRIHRLDTMLEPSIEAGHAEVAVIAFDSQVHHIGDFTDDAQQVSLDLQQVQPGDGGAAILDAVSDSVQLLASAPKDHQRVLLLISETRDHGSHSKIADVVADVGKANAVMYALAFSPSFSNILDTGRGNHLDEMHPSPDLLGPLVMTAQAMRKNAPRTIAGLTGGEYELFATRTRFEARMNDFTNHLHSRYLLSIAPKDPHPGMHQIRVRLKQSRDCTVLARDSYWAQANQ